MTHPQQPPRSEPWLPAWGAFCFFISGAAGLLYEVVWSKQLTYLLGSSLHAVATVVAAFLGGLALGARFLGVPLARRGTGGRVYALLELGVGVLGVILLPILRGLEPLVGQLYRSLGGESAGFGAARFALLFVLLLPPTALMGATLPVLVARFERDWVGPALARLYALNTLGAVLGTAVAGFVLLPAVGLAATTWVAASSNLAAALVAWRASAGRPPVAATPASEIPASAVSSASASAAPRAPATAARPAGRPAGRLSRSEPLTGPGYAMFAALVALSGFAALAFQIAWVRLFGLVFGSSVYSFSAVLGVYLLGLAIGSAAVARFMERGVSLARFARLQWALAVVAALELFAFSRLPEWMYAMAERAGPRWGTLFTWEIGLTGALLLAPCALLGAAFPVATRLLQRGDGGHAAGFAYAMNTIGTIGGSLFAGFFAVPSWGVQGTHLAALLLSAGIAVATLLLARGRGATRKELALALGALVVVSAVAVAAPRWDPSLMTAGVYRPAQARELGIVAPYSSAKGSTVWRATRLERVLYYREGVNGSVIVGTDLQGANRWLRVGGKTDASTGKDMGTQVLLGLVPMACADSGARALVIGLGSGITLAGVLAAGAGPTDVVEIEPGVVEASRFFFPVGQSPLDDSRVHLVRGDARTHLEHSGNRYGVIVSEPSNPWIAGVNNLFTVDFYRRVRAHLEPDGVFCQWMQLYELTPETFAIMARSLLEVFPEGEIFSVWRSVDALLVAMPKGRHVALERLQSPSALRLLNGSEIGAPERLAGFYAGPFAALAPAVRAADINRDDLPIVEYRAPHDLVRVGRASQTADPNVSALVPRAERPPDGPLFSAWPTESWYESRVRLLVDEGATALALANARRAGDGGEAALARRLETEVEAGDRRNRGLAAVDEARSMLAMGRETEGQRALERAAEIDPSNRRTWLMLADRRLQTGNLDGAEDAVAHGTGDEDSVIAGEAAAMAGLVAGARAKPAEAIQHFRQAERLSPKVAINYLLEARSHLAMNDRAAAGDALRRGLALLPGDASLTQALTSMGVAR